MLRTIESPKFAIGSLVIYTPRGSDLAIESRILDHLYSKMRGYLYLLDLEELDYHDKLFLEAHLKPIKTLTEGQISWHLQDMLPLLDWT